MRRVSSRLVGRLVNRLVGAALAVGLAWAPLAPPAHALDIQLISGDWQPINIFVENFGGESALSLNLPSRVIGADLTRSGHFRVTRAPHTPTVDDARLNRIADRGGEYLLAGSVTANEETGQFVLRFHLHDILTGDVLGSFETQFNAGNQRLAAHNISNWVYEKIIGRAGVFHTKVVYVVRDAAGNNTIKIADYDGYNRQTILSSKDHIISPAWSPDGNEIVYVSFEQNKPIIYRQSLLDGKREVVANFKGSNSAPAVDPKNPLRIAAALTEHGGAQQIYLIDPNKKVRIRRSGGIDTEPMFSPDGERLAFVSDAAGSLQVYEMNLATRQTQRISPRGSRYNASPQYASDGRSMVFIRRDNDTRHHNIALLNLATRQMTTVTDIHLADSPSLAPNDDIIIFKDEKKPNYLVTVSVNGKIMVAWDVPETGEVIDPAWGPSQSDWFK